MGRKPKNMNFALMAGFPLNEKNQVILLDIPFQDRTDAVPDPNEEMVRELSIAFEQGPGPEEKLN